MSTRVPQFAIREIDDSTMRRNFELLADFLKAQSPLLGFQFMALTFNAPSPPGNIQVRHSLGFLPKDVILMSTIGSGVVTFNYSKFDVNNLDITITGTVTKDTPTIIRILVGTYNPQP